MRSARSPSPQRGRSAHLHGRHADAPDAGSTLAFVLIVLTIAGTLAAAAALAYVARERMARADVRTLQARYASESGLHAALLEIERGRAPLHGLAVPLPGGDTAHIAAQRFGSLWAIRSTARARHGRETTLAFAGQRPPPRLGAALVVTDTSRALHVAGTTVITGDVWTGARGVVQARRHGHPFTGHVGDAHHVLDAADIRALRIDAAVYDAALAAATAMLRGARRAAGEPGAAGEPAPACQLPSDRAPLLADAPPRLTRGDAARLAAGRIIASPGRLEIDGAVSPGPGATIIAADTLRLSGHVTGGPALFVSLRAITIERGARVTGQFIAPSVTVAGGAHIRYPSSVHAGEADRDAPALRLAPGAGVDGTLVHAAHAAAHAGASPLAPSIEIAAGARVRGAVLNAGATALQGEIHGTLLTSTLYHYEAPARYVGWLLDARLEAAARPAPFVMPALVGPRPTLTLIDAFACEEASP